MLHPLPTCMPLLWGIRQKASTCLHLQSLTQLQGITLSRMPLRPWISVWLYMKVRLFKLYEGCSDGHYSLESSLLSWLCFSTLWLLPQLYPPSFCCSVTKSCWLFVTPWTAAYQTFYPSPSLEVCPSSCPLNWWCHPTISSSVALFSFCLQSFPASGSFPMNQLFVSGSQSIGVSPSVFPMSI